MAQSDINNRAIYRAIDSFISIFESVENNDEDTNIQLLTSTLDDITSAMHFVHPIFEDNHPNPPRMNYDVIRSKVRFALPSLGLYNIPSEITHNTASTSEITHNTASTSVIIADAIDDTTDILIEMYSVLWCRDHTSENDALYQLKFAYDTHIGNHVRNLQWYLHAFKNEI